MTDLNTFISILILTTFNQRPAIKDYWSTNPLLECPVVRSAMTRNTFLRIKNNLKYSKQSEKNLKDPAWRVRTVFEMFKKNIKVFGYFQTAISVDEMMVKFYGRLMIKQFIRNKPIRFGVKIWALCGADGYLYDCDIYCGKRAVNDGKLSKCALGSRVVMNILADLLATTSRRKLADFHLYCDNFFTCPDLFIHLKLIGLKATGVVRRDRIQVQNQLDKKVARGSHAVQHEKTSGLNFITLMDSKEVSIISTAGGVQPLKIAKRYSKEKKEKIEIGMPSAFSIYNKYMGGVDLHDQYCSKATPKMKSKKWTWSILTRLIASSLSNGLIIRNAVNENNKMSMKEFALSVVETYIQKAKIGGLETHTMCKNKKRKNCSTGKCDTRTYFLCENCNKHYCKKCFTEFHNPDLKHENNK